MNVRSPFLWLPLILLLEDLLPTGFLRQVIVGVGWPVAEQKNFAWLPSLTLMSLVLNLSDISGGTTTSNDATYDRYNRMSLNDNFSSSLVFLHLSLIKNVGICTWVTIGTELIWHMYSPASFGLTSLMVNVHVSLSLCVIFTKEKQVIYNE